jgi:alkylation response protein AidB-like acyl-CoA dehydrogenase
MHSRATALRPETRTWHQKGHRYPKRHANAYTSKIFTIFEGTSEIQRMIIGRAVTGLDVR